VWERFKHYNHRDVEGLRSLYNELAQRMDESEWTEYWQREEVPYSEVLLDMELRGMPIDLGAVAELTPVIEEATRDSRAELLAEGGLPSSFNLNSQPQLVTYLFSRVAHLGDVLVYDTETIQCLKSCLDGEHEDCPVNTFPGGPSGPWTAPPEEIVHLRDCLPPGFVLDKLGRDRVHGHWVVKGRGLAPTEPTLNKVTGERGKLPSTSSPELLYMHAEDDWVRKLCTEYRKTEKLLTTYLRKFPVIARTVRRPVEVGVSAAEVYENWHQVDEPPFKVWEDTRIYGRFNQTGTVTGRLSSSDPNMQNMPSRGERGKQIRSLFSFPEDSPMWLIIADYDQLEMRIMAHMSEDPRLLRVFREGGDPHEMLAHGIFGDVDVRSIAPGAALSYRDAGKQLNYAMGYGAGPRKIAQTLSLFGFPTSKEVARGYLAEMERFYSGLFRWKQATIAQAKRKGNVATMGGRRRRLRGAFKDTANWKAVGYGERQAVNAKVQGTAADIIRRAMVTLAVEVPEAPMLAQIHDELVFEWMARDVMERLAFDDGRFTIARRIQDIGEMAHGFDLKVPLVFSPHVGKSWADKSSDSLVDLYMEDDDALAEI